MKKEVHILASISAEHTFTTVFSMAEQDDTVSMPLSLSEDSYLHTEFGINTFNYQYDIAGVFLGEEAYDVIGDDFLHTGKATVRENRLVIKPREYIVSYLFDYEETSTSISKEVMFSDGMKSRYNSLIHTNFTIEADNRLEYESEMKELENIEYSIQIYNDVSFRILNADGYYNYLKHENILNRVAVLGYVRENEFYIIAKGRVSELSFDYEYITIEIKDERKLFNEEIVRKGADIGLTGENAELELPIAYGCNYVEAIALEEASEEVREEDATKVAQYLYADPDFANYKVLSVKNKEYTEFSPFSKFDVSSNGYISVSDEDIIKNNKADGLFVRFRTISDTISSVASTARHAFATDAALTEARFESEAAIAYASETADVTEFARAELNTAEAARDVAYEAYTENSSDASFHDAYLEALRSYNSRLSVFNNARIISENAKATSEAGIAYVDELSSIANEARQILLATVANPPANTTWTVKDVIVDLLIRFADVQYNSKFFSFNAFDTDVFRLERLSYMNFYFTSGTLQEALEEITEKTRTFLLKDNKDRYKIHYWFDGWGDTDFKLIKPDISLVVTEDIENYASDINLHVQYLHYKDIYQGKYTGSSFPEFNQLYNKIQKNALSKYKFSKTKNIKTFFSISKELLAVEILIEKILEKNASLSRDASLKSNIISRIGTATIGLNLLEDNVNEQKATLLVLAAREASIADTMLQMIKYVEALVKANKAREDVQSLEDEGLAYEQSIVTKVTELRELGLELANAIETVSENNPDVLIYIMLFYYMLQYSTEQEVLEIETSTNIDDLSLYDIVEVEQGINNFSLGKNKLYRVYGIDKITKTLKLYSHYDLGSSELDPIVRTYFST